VGQRARVVRGLPKGAGSVKSREGQDTCGKGLGSHADRPRKGAEHVVSPALNSVVGAVGYSWVAGESGTPANEQANSANVDL
jgi:hypothetical protein